MANAAISKAAEAGGYEFLDVHDMFLDEKGDWNPRLTFDGTHLTAKGYDVLARPIAKRLNEILKIDSR